MTPVAHILCLVLLLATASIGCAQSSRVVGKQEPPESSAASPQLGDLERRIGPLRIKERVFTVVLHLKHLGAGASDVGSEETVTRMEIRDEAGKVHYEATFPYDVEVDHFAETIGISAQPLEGKQGSGLLVTIGTEPSTPLGGESYQVFGLFNNQLVPFSKPILMEGNMVNEKPGEAVVKTSVEPGLRADVLHFRVWTGNFFVVIPVRLDWLQARASLAWRCTKRTSRGDEPVCRFNPEVKRIPTQDELTFVRLLPDYFEPDATAQHVVVKKNSTVEFLDAAGIVLWNEEAEAVVQLDVGDDPWLKVRIDGKEGWIHTQEDFAAIGVPQSG